MSPDPTYNLEEIKQNPTWHAAWILSEWYNDSAPIGWARYMPVAASIVKGLAIVKVPDEKENPE